MDERFKKHLARDLEWIQKQMEEMMGRPLFSSLQGRSVDPGCFLPATDVFETPDHVFVRVDLPGVEGDRVSVVLDGGILTISGRRYERMPEGVERIRRHQMEIDYGFFMRKVHLAVPLREGSTKAAYRDGVLEILIEKAPTLQTVPVTIEPEEGKAR